MARRFSQAAHEILADRAAPENQMISDIQVKSFLTRGIWGNYLESDETRSRYRRSGE